MGQYYQKINTIFKRDLDPKSPTYNCILLDEPLTQPEFEALRNVKWEATEKIDGTNTSVCTTPIMEQKFGIDCSTGDCCVTYHGKSPEAQVPPHLLKKLEELFPRDKVIKYFSENSKFGEITETIQVFGEGYGNKIQKCGNRYIKDFCGFILFDVRIGNWWLQRSDCEAIAEAFNIPIVPFIGLMTIDEAIDYVRKGFKSRVSEDTTLDAEGLVLKAPCGILDRKGERIIAKIKTCDFKQLERKTKIR